MGKAMEAIKRQKEYDETVDEWVTNIALFAIFLAVLFLVPGQW